MNSLQLRLFLLLIWSSTGLAYTQTLSEYYPEVKGELITHLHYTLDYNESAEQANWVIYFAGETGSAKRDNNFRPDPSVTTLSATLDDYAGSGYDRGHLAPAADLSINSTAMSESFYLSNMSPQLPSFNRGIWKKLEALVRTWSLETNSATDVVITGPILEDSCGTIGDGVRIPCAYYKIYADLNSNRAIGFILNNEPSSQKLSSFVHSIDEIEAATGIDFFYKLPNEQELQLESLKDISSWSWNVKTVVKSDNKATISTGTKCTALTKKGLSCSRTADSSGLCWQHKKN